MSNAVLVGVVLVTLGLVGALYVTVLTRRTAAAVNAAVATAATLVPLALDAVVVGQQIPLLPELTLWIGIAGFLHVLGMFGLYESTSWWDHLTHFVSSALVAALLYAGLLVTTGATTEPGRVYAALLTLVGVVVVGAVWELGELVARDVGRRYDVEPVLVHYGWRDTGLDLVFDVVGALVVVGLDVRTFVPLVQPLSNATGTLLVAGGVVVLSLRRAGDAG
jgi:hypothetical protein